MKKFLALLVLMLTGMASMVATADDPTYYLQDKDGNYLSTVANSFSELTLVKSDQSLAGFKVVDFNNTKFPDMLNIQNTSNNSYISFSRSKESFDLYGMANSSVAWLYKLDRAAKKATRVHRPENGGEYIILSGYSSSGYAMYALSSTPKDPGKTMAGVGTYMTTPEDEFIWDNNNESIVWTITDGSGVKQCATPELSVPAGEVARNTRVTVSCSTPGATIHYSWPGGSIYTDPAPASFYISQSFKQEIWATAEGYEESEHIVADWIVPLPTELELPIAPCYPGETSSMPINVEKPVMLNNSFRLSYVASPDGKPVQYKGNNTRLYVPVNAKLVIECAPGITMDAVAPYWAAYAYYRGYFTISSDGKTATWENTNNNAVYISKFKITYNGSGEFPAAPTYESTLNLNTGSREYLTTYYKDDVDEFGAFKSTPFNQPAVTDTKFGNDFQLVLEQGTGTAPAKMRSTSNGRLQLLKGNKATLSFLGDGKMQSVKIWASAVNSGTPYEMTLSADGKTATYEPTADIYAKYFTVVFSSEQQQCAIPVFEPAGSTTAAPLYEGTRVKVTCETEGATLHYYTSKTQEVTTSLPAEIVLGPTANYFAWVTKDGMVQSEQVVPYFATKARPPHEATLVYNIGGREYLTTYYTDLVDEFGKFKQTGINIEAKADTKLGENFQLLLEQGTGATPVKFRSLSDGRLNYVAGNKFIIKALNGFIFNKVQGFASANATGTAVDFAISGDGTEATFTAAASSYIKTLSLTFASTMQQCAVPVFEPNGSTSNDPLAAGTAVKVTCETPGTTLHYYTSSTVEATVALPGEMVLGDKPANYTTWVTKDGMVESRQVTPYFYTVVPQPTEAPVFTPDGGTVKKGTEITITTSNERGVIHYYINDADSAVVTVEHDALPAKIVAESGMTITAWSSANWPYYKDSEKVSRLFLVEGGGTTGDDEPIDTTKCMVPVFSVPSGDYTEPFEVQVTCRTPGAQLNYMYNYEKDANGENIVYTDGLPTVFYIAKTTVIEAWTSRDSLPDSEHVFITYELPDSMVYDIPASAFSGLPTADQVDPYTVDVDGFTFTFCKNEGSSWPVYNATNGDARIYAKGSLQINCNLAELNIESINFYISEQGRKRLGEMTASNGEIGKWNNVEPYTLTWTGDSKEVLFTVPEKATLGTDGDAKAAQFDFDRVKIRVKSAPQIGINSLEADIANGVVFYNLQGARVNYPQNGVFIRIEGNKATKIRL